MATCAARAIGELANGSIHLYLLAQHLEQHRQPIPTRLLQLKLDREHTYIYFEQEGAPTLHSRRWTLHGSSTCVPDSSLLLSHPLESR